VPRGSYAVLMGPTGCGKTTLLELIAGLRSPTLGEVWLDGRNVTDCPPGLRRIGYAPQDRALFQTYTVAEHLAFGPDVLGWPRAAIDLRVAELATMLGITALLARYPTNLSGGEAARVALGRALASRPNVLLLDEPLTGLDESTHDEMMMHLQAVRDSRLQTILHVTHSRREALALGDQCIEWTW